MYVVEALARGAAPAPHRYPAAGCGVQHTRRDAVAAAARTDLGLRSRATQMGGGRGAYSFVACLSHCH